MAANTNPIFEKAPGSAGQQFTSADTTTKKTLLAGGTDGSRVDAINVSTTDTSTVVLNFYYTIGGTDYFRGSVSIPTLTGTAGAATIDCVPLLAATLGYLPVSSTATLKCACNATMTALKTTDVVLSYGDY